MYAAKVHPVGAPSELVELPDDVGLLRARTYLPTTVPEGSRADLWSATHRDRLRFDGVEWQLVGSTTS